MCVLVGVGVLERVGVGVLVCVRLGVGSGVRVIDTLTLGVGEGVCVGVLVTLSAPFPLAFFKILIEIFSLSSGGSISSYFKNPLIIGTNANIPSLGSSIKIGLYILPSPFILNLLDLS